MQDFTVNVSFILSVETSRAELEEKIQWYICEACTKIENEWKHDVVMYNYNIKEY